MKKVIIAGGGLAGLSLGVALRRRGIPVLVLEAGNYPRHRVCGEFISGLKSDELADLGIAPCFANAIPQRTTAWFDGAKPFLTQALPEEARGLSRFSLDQALAKLLLETGGELETNCRHAEDGEGIVWACGRQRQPSAWMGLKAHFRGVDLKADLEIHFGTGAYVGLTRVENGSVNVCGLFRRTDPVRHGHALLRALQEAGLHNLSERLDSAETVEGTLKGVNQFALGWQKVRDARASVGDAAAMIPPFTGNGMTMAFQSALAAVEPLELWSAGSLDWPQSVQLMKARQQERFGRRLRWAQFLQAVLMNRSGRLLAGWLLRRGVVNFKTLYHKVR